jgi:hypothetical protein
MEHNHVVEALPALSLRAEMRPHGQDTVAKAE